MGTAPTTRPVRPPTLEEIRRQKAVILRLAADYGASNVRVFGSVVRGEATEGSDVDFLVDMEPGRTLFDLGGLLAGLEELLGCPVDVGLARSVRPELHERIMGEAVPL